MGKLTKGKCVYIWLLICRWVSVIRIEALSTCARRGGANQNPDKPDSCAPARPAYTNAGPKLLSVFCQTSFLCFAVFLPSTLCSAESCCGLFSVLLDRVQHFSGSCLTFWWCPNTFVFSLHPGKQSFHVLLHRSVGDEFVLRRLLPNQQASDIWTLFLLQSLLVFVAAADCCCFLFLAAVSVTCCVRSVTVWVCCWLFVLLLLLMLLFLFAVGCLWLLLLLVLLFHYLRRYCIVLFIVFDFNWCLSTVGSGFICKTTVD